MLPLTAARNDSRVPLIALVDASAALGLLANPAMEISQERGTSAVTVGPGAGGTNTYAIDQWNVYVRGTLAVSAHQVAAPPFAVDGFRRLQNALRLTVTTAQGSLGANDGLCIEQPIEGTFLRSLGLGTADAIGMDIAMVVSASVAGTYTVFAQNGARDRSWNTNVTLAANTPTVVLVPVAALTSGTWPTDNTAAAWIGISLGAGTSAQAASLNTWVSTNSRGHASTTNLAATASATFTVGFAQAFPTGVLPYANAAEITGNNLARLLLTRRPFDDETRRCQRYFEPVYVSVRGYAPGAGSVADVAHGYMVPKRTDTPSVTLAGGSASNYSDIQATNVTRLGFRVYVVAANTGDAFYIDGRGLVYNRM